MTISYYEKLAIIFLLATTIAITTISEAQEIPSSARSRAAITRVKPKLQKEFTRSGFNWGTPVFIRIFKTYSICTYGLRALGPKIRQGDGRAPQGFYYVSPRQMNPLSDFHLSFNLGYPNAYETSAKLLTADKRLKSSLKHPEFTLQ